MSRPADLGIPRGLAAATALCLVGLAAAVAADKPEILVPASWNQKNDGQGFRWDVQPYNGQIGDGSNDCFDGGGRLLVNGSEFQNHRGQAMMTQDGATMVITGQTGGLDLARRITVDAAAAACRYVEVLRNPGATPLKVTIMLGCNLGGNPQGIQTDQGRANPSVLDEKESALVAVQDPRYGGTRPSLVWVAASPRRGLKPSVTIQGDSISFTWSLDLKPQQTVALVHTLLQRNMQSVPGKAEMAKLLKPVVGGKWLADLPPELAKAVLNFPSGVDRFAAGPAPTLARFYETIGASPIDADQLLIGAATRLLGEASCRSLAVATGLGDVNLDLRRVAAIVGPVGGRPARIALRDGQVLIGVVRAEGLRIRLRSGMDLDLDAEHLDRLVLAATPVAAEQRTERLIETVSGLRLAVAAGQGGTLPCFTARGPLALALAEVDWLRPAEEGFGHLLGHRSGTSLRVFLGQGTLALDTILFGKRDIPIDDINAVYSPEALAAGTEESADDSARPPHAMLAGGAVFVGALDCAEIRFLVAGEPVAVTAAMIRSLANHGDEDSPGSPLFQVDLWDGSSLAGTILDQALPLRGGGLTLRVPPIDLVSLISGRPAIPEGLRQRIAEAIQDLGASDWNRREAASRSLAEIGALARDLLEQTRENTRDLEVRRRLDALLDREQPR